MGALQSMVDGMKQAGSEATIPDQNHIQTVVQAVKPTINDLLAQNIPQTQIKQTINDYYAANPDGVTPEGLQKQLMSLSQVQTPPAEQVAPADAPVPQTPAIQPVPPPTEKDADRRVLTPAAVNPPSLPVEVAQTAPQTATSPEITPVNGSAALPAPVAATPATAQGATPADSGIPTHLDSILSAPAPQPGANQPVQAASVPSPTGNGAPAADAIPAHLDSILSTPVAPGASAAPPVAGEPEPKHDLLYRIATGLQDPLVGIGQLATHIIPSALQPPGYTAQIDKEVNQREADYRKNHDVEGVDWARLGGNITSPANAMLPLKAIAGIDVGKSALPRIARSAFSGAVMAAAQPTETDKEVGYAGGKTFQSALGALTAGSLTSAGEGISRAIKPEISSDVQTLLDHNVRVGTDQMAGEGGSKLTSVPIVGNLINESHNRAVEDLNTAVLNKSLGEIGEKIPPTVSQAGNDAIAYTRQRLSDNYDQLLPSLAGNINEKTTNTLGQRLLTDGESVIGGDKPMSFAEKFGQLMKDKYYDMHMDTTKQLGTILTKEISGVVGNDGSFTGQQFKNIEAGLNYKISNYSASPNPQDRLLANALTDVKGMLKDQLSSANPEGAQALKNINRAYSMFKVAQRAASSTAAPNGVFNPSQLYAAVKNADKSLDKRAFTEGKLPLYDLASAAKNVLSDYKDSGTAGRALAAGAAGAVATGGVQSLMTHPVGTALGALTAGYYSQPGQAAARYLMTTRPEGAGALSELVKNATDAATLSPYSK